MKLLSRISLLIAFILFFLGVKSQENFTAASIVTSRNDTLKGLIDLKKGENPVCYFKGKSGSETKEYKPSDIKSIKYENGILIISKVARSVKGNSIQFMEVLVLGAANLYSFYDGLNSHFILEKSGDILDLSKAGQKVFSKGKLFEYDAPKYTSLLRYAFADYQKLYPLIDQASLSESSLIEIAMKYNKYKNGGQEIKVYKEPLPRAKLRVSPLVALNSTRLTFNNSFFYPNYQIISSYPYLSAGIVLNSAFIRSKTNFSLQVSGEYGKSSFYGSGISPANSFSEEVRISFATIKGKGGIKYIYPKGKFRPSLMISANVISIQNVSGKITDHVENPETPVQEFKDVMILTNSPLVGYSLDLGLGYYGNKLRPFLNIGYENSTGNHIVDPKYAFASKDFHNKLSTIYLSAGIFF